MSRETTNQKPTYYYYPRFRHFNIYKRYPDGTEVKVNEAMTRDAARRMVYKLNGWKENKLTNHDEQSR